MSPRTPQLLLSLLCLLSAASGQNPLVYNCSDEASPVNINPRSMRFGLRLSTGGSHARFCHALIRAAGGSGSGSYFYVRLNSSLASSFSLLSLSSDFGPSGVPVAWVTAANQTVYRAFAAPSGSSLYARLSSSSGGGAAVSDSVLLDVHLVTGCPPNWHSHNGACYGAPSADTAAATFRGAVVGCRHVRANLAMGFDSAGVVTGAINATGSWPANQSVWIGAAVSGSRMYFLDGHMLSFGDIVKLRDPLADSEASLPPGSEWHCVFSQGGEFYRRSCSSQLPYLCSCPGPGLPRTFYTLDGVNRLLAGGVYGRTSPEFCYFALLAVGILGLVAAALSIALSPRIRRAVVPRCPPRFLDVGRRRRVRWLLQLLSSEGGSDGCISGGGVAAPTSVATAAAAPPAYTEFGDVRDVEGKPPTYRQAVTIAG